MRVLVTGGAGYIGSVVTESLLARGHSALVYDNLRTGYRDAVIEGAAFVHADLLDRGTLDATLRRHRIEAEVVAAASRVTGRPIPTRVGPRRPGDPAVLVADAGRIEAQLGWRPALGDLGRIVDSTWRWMERRRPASH